LRSFLAKFLFKGDDVYKHVRDLSGGEKGRLALAKLIYSHVNVLVLDEPTNHLDIPSREALEEALDAYGGTILTISHDRYFLDRIATQILALDGEGLAEHYDGDYTEFHDWKAAGKAQFESVADRSVRPENLVEVASQSRQRESSVAGTNIDSEGKRSKKPEKVNRPRVKLIKKKQAARASETVEAEISVTEQSLKQLSEQMSQPDVARDVGRLLKLSEEYQQTETKLRQLYDEWEQGTAEAAPSPKSSQKL
jgi:ATP-binding cassette subfamily F protein 3